MERSELEQYQLERLNRLLEINIPGNLFYTRKTQECGLTFPTDSISSLLKVFPFTTKEELVTDQRVHPPYGTNLAFPRSQYSRYHQTSGTSGNPMRWLDTRESWDWMVDNWIKVYHGAGVDEKDTVFFAFSFGPFLGFWTAFDAAAKMGCLCVPGGGMSSAARLRIIEENSATVLCCTPTYALRLGETAAEKGFTGRVRTIIVAGEPGGGIPQTRERIEALWPDSRVVDHHGMTEVGPVSFTMRDDPDVLRIIETSYLAEIVEPRGERLVAPGKTGELVLTTLGRLGSPLIRYRTGDLVRRSRKEPDHLSCYRLKGGILGRLDDMILVRGVNIYPSAVERVVRRFQEVSEYRVLVKTERNMTELEIQIECAAPNKKNEVSHRLEAELRSVFTLRIPVVIVPSGSLPRFEMKAKRWVLQTNSRD